MIVAIAVDLEKRQAMRLEREFPEVTFLPAVGEAALAGALPECDVLFGGRPTAETLERAGSLKWLQTYSAGVNHLPLELLACRDVLVTNASGAHAVQISENILA
ncbi:MAG TPA: hypothetical protein VGS41_11400, partial [Chthonomonadales bacterium]|nr:hypothetical protein [Chthonomonadales bacterium]